MAKKRKEIKEIYIAQTTDRINEASNSQIIDWKPTGEEVENSNGDRIKCYEARIGNVTLRTMIKTVDKRSWFWGDRVVVDAYGLRIESEGISTVLTSNQDMIPGVKSDFIDGLVRWVNTTMTREETLLGTIEKELMDILKETYPEGN